MDEAPIAPHVESKIRKRIVKKFMILGIVAIAAIGAAGYFLVYPAFKQTPAKLNDQDVQSLVAAVGKLIYLPTDETPTIATVTDPSKLANQPFFANAEQGYRVLIYTRAKKAILYDPFTNRIVNVAPIDLGSAAQLNSAPATATSTE